MSAELALAEPAIVILQQGKLLSVADRTSVSVTLETGHSAGRLWKAFTDPAEYEQWLYPMDLPAEVGAPVEYRSGGGHVQQGKVLEWQEGRKVVTTWTEVGEPSLKDPDTDTVVTFLIEPGTDGGASFTFRHEGITKATKYAAGWLAHWEMLEGYLAGTPVAFMDSYSRWLPRYEPVFGPFRE